MRTTRSCVVVLLAVCLMSEPVLGHGGGLDRCGGHNNRKSGGYHVHNHALAAACRNARSSAPTPAPAGATATTQRLTEAPTGSRSDGCSQDVAERVASIDRALVQATEVVTGNDRAMLAITEAKLELVRLKLALGCKPE